MPPPGLPQDTKDRIVALYREGLTAPRILRIVDGVTKHQVYDLVRLARDVDPTLPYRRKLKGEAFKGRVLRLYIPAVVLSRAAAQAHVRGMTTETLIAKLITAVALDDIFAAVLDD